MATTTNFGWNTPDDTDYVKDGAAAIRTLGSAIDTSLADLKGGTTGQILSKNTNTDLDYTWIDNQVGDITEITVTAPITGGGSSGSVGIGIQDGTTSQKGAVQLEDSTSSTSTSKAATPKSVKSAYDLAAAAAPLALSINTQTDSYTLALTDAGKSVEMNKGTANNLTVPPNSSVAFPVGTQILVTQLGAGQTTIVAGSGVTIRQADSKLKLAKQYAQATLVKRATDEWVLSGNLAA